MNVDNVLYVDFKRHMQRRMTDGFMDALLPALVGFYLGAHLAYALADLFDTRR